MKVTPEEYIAVLQNAFNKHYHEGSDVWSDDPEMRVVPSLIQGQLKLPATTIALDIGCGIGWDTDYFSRIYQQATGIDLYQHENWVTLQKKRLNVAFYQTGYFEFDPGQSFDLILDNGCFHHQHPEHYQAYLDKVTTMLAAGGWYAISTFKNDTKTKYWDPNGRLHRYFTDVEFSETLEQANLKVHHEIDIYRAVHQDYYRLSLCQPFA